MTEELETLIHQVQGSENVCSISELLSAELEIPVCSEFSDSTWDEQFTAEVGPHSKHT